MQFTPPLTKLGQNRKRLMTLLLKIIASSVFIIGLAVSIDWGGFLDRIRAVDPFFLSLSIALSFLMICVSVLKWGVIIGADAQEIPLSKLLRFYFIGYYFTSLLPSNFGGDFVRAHLAGVEVGNRAAGLASVFVERATGLLMLLVLAVVVPLGRPPLLGEPLVFVPALAALGALILIVLGLLSSQKVRTSSSKMLGKLEDSQKSPKLLLKAIAMLRRFLTELTGTLTVLLSKPRAAKRVIYLTVAFYALTWLNVYLGYRSFGVEPSLNFFFVLPTAMMVSSLPVSAAGNLGFLEGVYVVYFSLVGLDGESTMAMILLTRAKTILSGLIGMILFLSARVPRQGPAPGC